MACRGPACRLADLQKPDGDDGQDPQQGPEAFDGPQLAVFQATTALQGLVKLFTDLSMLRHGQKEGPQRACAQVRRVRDDLAPVTSRRRDNSVA